MKDRVKFRAGRWWTQLTPKLLGSIVILITAVSLVTTWRAAQLLRRNLEKAFEAQGEAIALALANSAEQAIGADSTAVRGSVEANRGIGGVKYIFVQDARGNTYLHTFTPTVPEGLEQKTRVARGEALEGKRVKVTPLDFASAQGRVNAIDIAAPVAGGALGSVHVGMDPDVIATEVTTLQREMAAMGALVTALGLILYGFVARLMLIRPIQELTRVTGLIVVQGDLTQKVEARSGDEIGQLAAMFSAMVERLKEIPMRIRESTQELVASVDQLRSSTTEQGQTVTMQAGALQETQVTAQEIRQTSLVAAQKAEAVLQYTERAEVISRSGEAAVGQSLAALTDIRVQVEEIAKRINSLGERTMQIGHVTQTVKDLADQSNMLALNAAIEAVRSGEHGKGFGVVAREIRSLADQSIQATQQVREMLEDISAAIREAVAITDKGAARIDAGLEQVKTSGEKLGDLSNIVKENSAAVRQISAAVGQQNAGIAQIFGAVTHQSDMMADTMKRLEATNVAVKTLSSISKSLVQIVEQFRV